MRSRSSTAMIWVLAGVVIAGASSVSLYTAPLARQPLAQATAPLTGTPLVGSWRQQGEVWRYRVNITPSVLFITSYDEADICEIEVLSREDRSGSGVLWGVIRLHRAAYEDLPQAGQPVRLSYALHDDSLELSWQECLVLSPRFSGQRLTVVPATHPEERADSRPSHL